ncbi:hypothetical protein RIF29_29817 [Crotalaria pallida]|uniref:Uncharacterized protein n=1 Tax=Crotalaria pallida TaxID=3830 RepID=A0AAN9HWJ7_CROPI
MANRRGRPPKTPLSQPDRRFSPPKRDMLPTAFDLSKLDDEDLAAIDNLTPKQLESLVHGLELILARVQNKNSDSMPTEVNVNDTSEKRIGESSGTTLNVNEPVNEKEGHELVVGGDRTEAENLTNATDSTEIDKEVETVPDSQEDNWTLAKSRRKAIAKLQAQRGEALKAHLVNG